MLQIFEFADFHDDTRHARFRALAARLGAATPCGDDPLYSYASYDKLPDTMDPGDLIYLSDIVFYGAVAWNAPPGGPDAGLQLISSYADLAQLQANPLFQVSRWTGDIDDAVRDPARKFHVLLNCDLLEAWDPPKAPRRQEDGVCEIGELAWDDAIGLARTDASAIFSNGPLAITDEIRGFLCGDELNLSRLGSIVEPCGVLGFCHMDDVMLLSIRSRFWDHPEPILKL